MGEVSKALGMAGSFEWHGRTYKLAPMSYECIAAWEDYLRGRAWRELEAAKKHLSGEEYREQSAGLRADFVGGKFSFFSQASRDAALLSWEGMIELAAIRVCAADESLEPIEVRKMVREIQEHDLSKWQEIQARMQESDHDPNPPAPDQPGTDAGTSTASAPHSPASPSACAPGKSAS